MSTSDHFRPRSSSTDNLPPLPRFPDPASITPIISRKTARAPCHVRFHSRLTAIPASASIVPTRPFSFPWAGVDRAFTPLELSLLIVQVVYTFPNANDTTRMGYRRKLADSTGQLSRIRQPATDDHTDRGYVHRLLDPTRTPPVPPPLPPVYGDLDFDHPTFASILFQIGPDHHHPAFLFITVRSRPTRHLIQYKPQ